MKKGIYRYRRKKGWLTQVWSIITTCMGFLLFTGLIVVAIALVSFNPNYLKAIMSISGFILTLVGYAWRYVKEQANKKDEYTESQIRGLTRAEGYLVKSFHCIADRKTYEDFITAKTYISVATDIFLSLDIPTNEYMAILFHTKTTMDKDFDQLSKEEGWEILGGITELTKFLNEIKHEMMEE